MGLKGLFLMQSFQIRYGALPASYAMVTGSYNPPSKVYRAWGWQLQSWAEFKN